MRVAHRVAGPIEVVFHDGHASFRFGRPLEQAQLRAARQYHGNHRAAASALSSGRVLKAIFARGAAL